MKLVYLSIQDNSELFETQHALIYTLNEFLDPLKIRSQPTRDIYFTGGL